jgi:hypothetical protein
MDPFHYIHLSEAEAGIDIRGSHVGLFVAHNLTTQSTTAMVVNLMDGRLSRLIEEPLIRSHKVISRQVQTGSTLSPRFILLVYLSSALRWWNNVLLCFNQQLVMHVRGFLNFHFLLVNLVLLMACIYRRNNSSNKLPRKHPRSQTEARTSTYRFIS